MSNDKPENHTDEHLQAHHRTAVRQVTTMVRWLLYLVFVVLAYIVLRYLAPVFTPILVAGGIAYLLDPAVDRLEARGITRVWAVTILLLLFLGTLTTAALVVAPLVAGDVAQFIRELPSMVENTAAWVATNLGYQVPERWQDFLGGEQVKSLLQEIAGPASALALAAVGSFFSLLGFLVELLLIPVFAFYFMLDWDHILKRLRGMIPPRHRATVVEIVVDIDRVVSAWIRGQFTVTAILAVLYAACFYPLDVPLAIPVGLLVGLLTVVPFLGTFVGAGITAVLLLLDWQSAGQLAGVAAVFVGLHLLEAAVLTPKIVGKKVGLGESGALFAVLAGGQLLGLAGVLLAVPIAASIAVLIRRLFKHYERSEFFGAGDVDGSVKKSDREVMREMVRDSRAAHAVLPGLLESPDSADAGASELGEEREDSAVGEDDAESEDSQDNGDGDGDGGDDGEDETEPRRKTEPEKEDA